MKVGVSVMLYFQPFSQAHQVSLNCRERLVIECLGFNLI